MIRIVCIAPPQLYDTEIASSLRSSQRHGVCYLVFASDAIGGAKQSPGRNDGEIASSASLQAGLLGPLETVSLPDLAKTREKAP